MKGGYITMKKSKALLLQEMEALDQDRLRVYQALREWWGYKYASYDWSDPSSEGQRDHEHTQRREVCMDMVALINSFRSRLSNMLGITHQWVPHNDNSTIHYIETTEVILGGDEGVSTTIDYGRAHCGSWDHGDNPPYKITMAMKGMKIELYATTTEDLLMAISRGYTCLRILDKGTRYYHQER